MRKDEGVSAIEAVPAAASLRNHKSLASLSLVADVNVNVRR